MDRKGVVLKSSTHVNRHKKAQPYIGILLPLIIIGGWIYPPLGYFLVGCMVMAIGYGVVKGRYWCDWLCPRGSFYDIYLAPLSRNKEVPGIFKNTVFRTVVMASLMAGLGSRVVMLWGDFYAMGRPMVTMLTATTIIGIALGIIYNERVWCMICPMGTLANWLGREKQLVTISSECNSCKKCARTCRMQLKPYDHRSAGAMLDADCLKCLYCVENCPKSALSFAGRAS
jgi:polyferredoxin